MLLGTPVVDMLFLGEGVGWYVAIISFIFCALTLRSQKSVLCLMKAFEKSSRLRDELPLTNSSAKFYRQEARFKNTTKHQNKTTF